MSLMNAFSIMDLWRRGVLRMNMNFIIRGLIIFCVCVLLMLVSIGSVVAVSSFQEPSRDGNSIEIGDPPVFSITDEGQVRIGLGAPEEDLDVEGIIVVGGFRLADDAAAGRVLTSDEDGNGSWRALPSMGGAWSVTNNNASYVTGNVGIGTEMPENLLSLTSGGNSILSIDASSSSFSAVDFYTGGSPTWGVGRNPGGDFYIDESGASNRLTIAQGGNVGIGTTGPVTPLEVVGSEIPFSSFGGAGRGIVTLRGGEYDENDFIGLDFSSGSAAHARPLARIGAQLTNSGSFLHFGTSTDYSIGVTTNAMTIDPSGRVGVGTTEPIADFHVQDSQSFATLRVDSPDSKFRLLTHTNGLVYIQVGEDDTSGSTTDLLITGFNGNPEHFRVRGDGVIQVESLKSPGSGFAFVCVSEDGELIRSSRQCDDLNLPPP